jgi:hypothetical protein
MTWNERCREKCRVFSQKPPWGQRLDKQDFLRFWLKVQGFSTEQVRLGFFWDNARLVD